jgi:hypothetical protein
MSKTYWLHKNSQDAITHLTEYHNQTTSFNNSPVRTMWSRNFIAYYSSLINTPSFDTSQIFMGYQGELIKFMTPKARGLVRQLINIITRQSLAFQAIAESTTQDVTETIKLSNSLTDQIVDHQRLNQKRLDAWELALALGSSFVLTQWNTGLGKPYRVINDRTIYEGGVEISIHPPTSLFYDVEVESWDNLAWAEVRQIRNRWDLIALYPGLRDEIMAVPSYWRAVGPNYWMDKYHDNEDLIPVYSLFARPSPSLPKGRHIMYSDMHAVYKDIDNKYECIPIEPLMPERIQGTLIGYSKLTDIIPSNEIYDNNLSAIATNNSQFAVQSVTVPHGANISPEQFANMNIIYYNPTQGIPGGGKPEPMQLTASAPETFKLLEVTDANMSEMSGIQPILQGQTQNITSGSMAATLSANGMQALDGLTKADQMCWENVMTQAIKCYQKFAVLDQEMTTYGKNNQAIKKSFNGKNLLGFTGSKMTLTPPVLLSTGGKMEVAQQLMQIPKELWSDYASIIEGRSLQEMFKGAVSQKDLIQLENEAMLQGNPAPVLATDNHAAHIPGHLETLNDPKIRANGKLVEGILAHVDEHINYAKTVDPMLQQLITTGTMPPPAAQAPMGPPGMQAPPEVMDQAGMVPPENIAAPAEPAQDLLGRQ